MQPETLVRHVTATVDPHRFNDARDAIDAASAFEAETLKDWNYAITINSDETYTVEVRSVREPRDLPLYLRPTA